MSKVLNYVSVPLTTDEDANRGRTTWRDGMCTRMDLGRSVELYVGHETSSEVDEEGNSRDVCVAFAFTVDKPVTRAKAINAAEMAAYNLKTDMDVASFNASLARKARMGETVDEVTEHDEFIEWVKVELTKIGV